MKNFSTIFISDTHLGSRGASADELLEFLKEIEHTDFDRLVLNGDIIDGWRLSSKWYFPQEHLNVIRKILSLAKSGKEIIYVAGNHDEFLRKFHAFDLSMGNVKIVNKYEHTSINGDKYLVVHGDGFDQVMKYHKWVAKIGDIGYNLLLELNSTVNRIRKWLRKPYWSLSKAIKGKVKEAANYIFAFEETAVKAAHGRYKGVICGHIHEPALRFYDVKLGEEVVWYMNSGDWVESCSWLAETKDGHFETWLWNDANPLNINSTENPSFRGE
jgi:UDP-2,3-diacylglucosamine pyrophosphatase LpxH